MLRNRILCVSESESLPQPLIYSSNIYTIFNLFTLTNHCKGETSIANKELLMKGIVPLHIVHTPPS